MRIAALLLEPDAAWLYLRRPSRRRCRQNEVFTREQIGHALAPPTPEAGRTAAERRQRARRMTAVDACRRRTTPRRASRASTRSRRRTSRHLQARVLSFSLAVNKGQEAAPIVADNTMYMVTAYPNIVYALDLTKPGAPLKWTFAPKPLPASQGVACCDVVNRGGTVDHGKYIFNTLDGQTIALDVKTGKPLWRTQLGNINRGETMTMAPAGGRRARLCRRFRRRDGRARLDRCAR